MVVAGDPNAPGYAVVGGMAAAPGYAVVGDAPGFGPEPVGVARGHQAAWGNQRLATSGMRANAGPYDPSVVPTSLPPAQVALAGPGHDRPHVISHMLGLPKIGRHAREREAKARAKHAAIAYGEPNRAVTELPASMVYARGNR
jgi:hypothetical protein